MRKAYVFGQFRLIPKNRLLLKNDTFIQLGARAYDILRVLVEHQGIPVSRIALMHQVWPDIFVDEAALRVNVVSLRKAIGDATPGGVIETVTGYGYRLSIPVLTMDADEAAEVDRPVQVASKVPFRRQTLIGRGHLIALIVKQLRARRFVVLHGAAGVGKTAIAVEAAYHLKGDYEIVSIVDFSEIGGLPPADAIASVLGWGSDASNVFRADLPGQNALRALVILDSCEHVLDEICRISRELLEEAPNLHLIVTSRKSRRSAQASSIRVEPLEFSNIDEETTLKEILNYPAMALFVEQARASGFGAMLVDQQAKYIVDVCRRLDGLPLAIELAVPWMAVMSPRDMVDQIVTALLTQSYGRQEVERHHTLKAALDWSYERLDPRVQNLFRELSVFQGEFTVAEALALSSLENISPSDVSPDLIILTEISLIEREIRSGNLIYRMLKTTRAYSESLEMH